MQKAYFQPIEGKRAPAFEKFDAEDSAYPDGQIAIKAAADLKQLAQAKTPFFMAVGLRKPHLPFNAPEKYWIDKPENISLPESWHNSLDAIPKAALHRSLELRMQYDGIPLINEPTIETAKQLIAAYYAAARFADSQAGHILKSLEQNDLEKNTIVIVLSDHGFLLGEQKMWTKHALFDSALRTPLIIAAPGFSGGMNVEAISDLLDIYPTLSDLVGLPQPKHLDGHSLLPLLENPSLTSRSNKEVSISRWMNGQSLRTATYRYTRWNDKNNETTAELLFNLENDPNELSNIINHSDISRELHSLRIQLDKHSQTAHWSASLEETYKFWWLVNTKLASYAMAARLYPLRALAGLLLIVCIIVMITRALRRKQRESK